jgi:GGDEF domain-containing protein
VIISIRRFLDQHGQGPPAGDGLLSAALQGMRVLLEGIAAHTTLGRVEAVQSFRRTVCGLSRGIEEPPSAQNLLRIAGEAVESLEKHSRDTGQYFREENEQMQSMVVMLTESVTELWGRQDVSVARLRAIEQRIEHAAGLDDIRALRAELGECLLALREAAAHQRGVAAATARHLEQQVKYNQSLAARGSRLRRGAGGEIDVAPEEGLVPPEPPPSCFVAAFKLRRADHIAARFGEDARQQMLHLVGASLKAVLQPEDRLLRWKGAAFVAFLTSRETLHEIRLRLSDAVMTVGQQHVEVGSKSALLSVAVDWFVFPQSQCPTFDAVFTELDAFLAGSVTAPPAEPAVKTGVPGGMQL